MYLMTRKLYLISISCDTSFVKHRIGSDEDFFVSFDFQLFQTKTPVGIFFCSSDLDL